MDARRRQFVGMLFAELERSVREYAELRERLASATQGAAQARRDIQWLLGEVDAKVRLGYVLPDAERRRR